MDGYIWLHRGILTCGRDLCKGIANKGYVSYFINRIVQLQRYFYAFFVSTALGILWMLLLFSMVTS